MKRLKLLLITFICICLITGTSCKNTEDNTTKAQTMEYAVAYELSNIEDIEKINDESAKALSIVIRTRLYYNKEYNNELQQNIENKNIDEKYLNIANQTSNMVLMDNDKLADVSYTYKEDEEWNTEIKKSEILTYMIKNRISLSNISDIEQIKNNDNELEYLVVGGKSIPFSTLKENFHLKSNKITSVKNNNSSILITGTTENNKNYFDYKSFKDKNDKNYREILKNSYNDYNIITI